MKLLKWVAVFFLTAVITCSFFGWSAHATDDLDFGTISINIPVSIETGTNYVKDAEDNDIGISDYWIDDGKAYLLSSTYNKIYVYQNGERVDAIDLDQYGITTILFAVNENQTWIYDNKGRIVLLEDWQEKANIQISSFADSEAIGNFAVRNGDLYVTIASFTERDFITYRIKLSGDQLVCAESIPGRLNGNAVVENVDAVRRLLDGMTAKQAEKDNYIFTAQQGVMDLGIAQDQYHYILSREILDDGVQEYYLQRVYGFSQDGMLKKVYNLPLTVPTCNEPVKVFDGIVYFLDTEKDYIKLNCLDNCVCYDIQDCLMPFNWSRINVENAQIESADNSNDSHTRATNSVTRFSCLSRFNTYCTPFTWSCSAANLLPLTGWQCPHYVTGAGSYNSMPYCWGGFCDWNAFNAGIQSGARVGNVNIGTIVSNTVGTDCSGAASRALALSYHCTTSGFPSITTLISWSNMRAADLILNPGSHVIMYYYTTSSGDYCVYECTIQGNVDRCMQRYRSPSALSAYSVYTYPGFSD